KEQEKSWRESMLFGIKQFGRRLWWLGIRGEKREREAFWYHLCHRLQKSKGSSSTMTFTPNADLEELLQKPINTQTDQKYPLISIIVLTYNHLTLNKQCLRSIYHETTYPNYEVILVDNASTDGTKEWLMSLAPTKHCKVILNKENLGFAAGNNAGIKEAKGDFIVLLNNDTYVTEDWLTNLWKKFQIDDKLGMCGAVTNSIGNEAKIDTENVEQYKKEHQGEVYQDPRALAFFCVMIKKQVIDECGLLDENYGKGMFEDDDYAEAVRRAGWKLAIAEDSFVWHLESASFRKLDKKEFRSIFETNRKYYEHKWGKKWIPHGTRK
ncbi:MAG: glycosyltransferase family 2 protein, partial [Lachnospiraceae bacterium]|nr:glycosyltransferase family 2 protein [Lachnospiraceae bacterium]